MHLAYTSLTIWLKYSSRKILKSPTSRSGFSLIRLTLMYIEYEQQMLGYLSYCLLCMTGMKNCDEHKTTLSCWLHSFRKSPPLPIPGQYARDCAIYGTNISKSAVGNKDQPSPPPYKQGDLSTFYLLLRLLGPIVCSRKDCNIVEIWKQWLIFLALFLNEADLPCWFWKP